jgi:hypothetical protein
LPEVQVGRLSSLVGSRSIAGRVQSVQSSRSLYRARKRSCPDGPGPPGRSRVAAMSRRSGRRPPGHVQTDHQLPQNVSNRAYIPTDPPRIATSRRCSCYVRFRGRGGFNTMVWLTIRHIAHLVGNSYRCTTSSICTRPSPYRFPLFVPIFPHLAAHTAGQGRGLPAIPAPTRRQSGLCARPHALSPALSRPRHKPREPHNSLMTRLKLRFA